VKANTLKYSEKRRGGFDPHARIVDGIDATFLYPSLGLFTDAVVTGARDARPVPGQPQGIPTLTSARAERSHAYVERLGRALERQAGMVPSGTPSRGRVRPP
jgi:hypothetical protein